MGNTLLIRARQSAAHTYHCALGATVYKLGIPVNGFVILAQGRTGSSFLTSLIGSHPRVRADGELFTEYVPRAELYALGRAARFSTFGKLWGFKVKNYHIKQCFSGRDLNFLKFVEDLNWKIIFLKRDNIVSSALSTIIGIRRKKFVYNTSNLKKFEPVYIDPNLFKIHLNGRIEQDKEDKKLLLGRRYFTIRYESDLAGGGDRAKLQEMLDYLNLNRRPLSSSIQKSDTRSPSDYVKNFDELHQVALKLGFKNYADETFFK